MLVRGRTNRLITCLFAAFAIFAAGCGEESGCANSTDCEQGFVCIGSSCVRVTDGGTTGGDASKDARDTRTSLDPGKSKDPGQPTDLIPDITPPKVMQVMPPHGAVNVTIPFTVEITFSEPMRAGSIGKVSMILEDVNGQQVDGARTLSADFTKVTFTPKPPLFPASPYTLKLNQFAKDLAGNELEATDPVTFYTAPPGFRDTHKSLAQKHAPKLYVGLEKSEPQFDIPTKVDLDGNWDTTNNVTHLKTQTLEVKPAVHWIASETKSHYFITYVYYWPQRKTVGGAPVPNDAAGAILTVRKSTSEPELITLLFRTTSTSTEVFTFGPDSSLFKDIEFHFGAADWFPGDASGPRPFEAYLPASSHESCLWSWDGHSALGQRLCRLDENLRQHLTSAQNQEGTVLVRKLNADSIKKQGGKWVIPTADVGYELVDLLDAWWLRRNKVQTSELWEEYFTYGEGSHPAGRPGAGTQFPAEFARHLAESSYAGRPPWAWSWNSGIGDGEQTGLSRGMVVVDTAYFVAWRHLASRVKAEVKDSFVINDGTGFSLEYCFNPFLNIDVRGQVEGCN